MIRIRDVAGGVDADVVTGIGGKRRAEVDSRQIADQAGVPPQDPPPAP